MKLFVNIFATMMVAANDKHRELMIPNGRKLGHTAQGNPLAVSSSSAASSRSSYSSYYVGSGFSSSSYISSTASSTTVNGYSSTSVLSYAAYA